MAGSEKGGDEKGSEPLFAQIPTAELRKILSERFARDVTSATWAKLLRTFTFFGLPGIVAISGLLWKVLDTEVAGKISAQRREVAADIAKSVDRDIAAARETLESRVNERVAAAFTNQYGQAVQSQLRSAMAERSFQSEMRATVRREVLGVWAQENEPLRRNFLEQVTANRGFLDDFAQQVARAMAQSDTVPVIIAEALDKTVLGARQEDAGRALAALALLAAVDQGRANAAARRLLTPGDDGKHELRDMALRGLRHVGFRGLEAPAGDATKMLELALSAWPAHCAAAACDLEQEMAQGLGGFFARGGELPGAERDAWVAMLSLWHEEMLRGGDRVRRASVHLVPRALNAIGTDEALGTLVRWFTSSRTDLALSAAGALGDQAASNLGDPERLALFKKLWPQSASAELRRALMAEAEWMALGRVSDGGADPVGAFRSEADLVRARPRRIAGRSPIARWAPPHPAGLERQRTPVPPAEPCAMGTEAPSQHRAQLCALAALIRPDRGAVEWSELRQVTPWEEDETEMLALLWTISASRATEGASGAEARLVPVTDLLRMRAPAPAGWRLAAMLLLRTAPDQAAWRALRQLRPSPAEAPMFVAASRWLFRPGAAGQAWVVEELRELPPAVRTAVAREIVAAALPPEEADADNRIRAVIRRLPSSGVAALNALRFAYAYEPDGVLAEVERENAFRSLADAASGGAPGGGVQAGAAEELLAALLHRAGWSQAVIEMARDTAPPPAPHGGARTPLNPSVQSRFGRLRLSGGDTLTVAPAEAGKASGAFPPVTFYNPQTRETRVLGAGGSWGLRGDAEEEWMFRLGAGTPALQLLAVPPETLVLAAEPSAADLPVVEAGRVYTVQALPDGAGGSADAAGWARTPRLREGDRLRISTFELAEGVDTVVELHRDAAEIGRNDDAGEGWESQLEWTADRDGEALIRLVNIGTPGAFRLAMERVEGARAGAAVAYGGSGPRPSRPR